MYSSVKNIVSLISHALSLARIASAASPQLGGAARFGALAQSQINAFDDGGVGMTVVEAAIGTYPGRTFLGFPPSIAEEEHPGDAEASSAQDDLNLAFQDIDAREATGSPGSPTAPGLGGKTFLPGVYKTTEDGSIYGQLTLDAGGDPNAVFIFEYQGSFMGEDGSSVVLINGAQACNVFFVALGGAGFALGFDTNWKGNIIAKSAAISRRGSVFQGSLYSFFGPVNLGMPTRVVLCDVIIPPIVVSVTPSVTPVEISITPSVTPVQISVTPSVTPSSSSSVSMLTSSSTSSTTSLSTSSTSSTTLSPASSPRSSTLATPSSTTTKASTMITSTMVTSSPRSSTLSTSSKTSTVITSSPKSSTSSTSSKTTTKASTMSISTLKPKETKLPAACYN